MSQRAWEVVLKNCPELRNKLAKPIHYIARATPFPVLLEEVSKERAEEIIAQSEPKPMDTIRWALKHNYKFYPTRDEFQDFGEFFEECDLEWVIEQIVRLGLNKNLEWAKHLGLSFANSPAQPGIVYALLKTGILPDFAYEILERSLVHWKKTIRGLRLWLIHYLTEEDMQELIKKAVKHRRPEIVAAIAARRKESECTRAILATCEGKSDPLSRYLLRLMFQSSQRANV